MWLNGKANGSYVHKKAARWDDSSWAFWRKKANEVEADPFRGIALQLHQDSADGKRPRSVLITTPSRNDMGARASVGIATSLAVGLNRPVLLADVSPGEQSVTELMLSSPRIDFCDLLFDPGLSLDDMLLPTTQQCLTLAPSTKTPSHYPAAANVALVLDKLYSRFDFVVISGGGMLGESLTRVMAQHAGCVLLVGVENETLTDDFDAAQASLALGHAKRVALLLTVRAE